MRYLRKYVQRVGFVSTMLIGGVLGGLMAPPLSEAVPPELKLLIDNQSSLESTTNGTTFTTVTGNSILGSSVACSLADTGLGYTNCYSITTSTTVAYRANNNRLYRIQNAPSSTARLRVGDNPGQDHLSLVGVQFVPVNTANQMAPGQTVQANTLTNWGSPDANTNETHTLTITIKNTFNNSAVNVNNATQYDVNNIAIENTKLPAALRMGGRFTSGIVDTNTVVLPNPLYCGPSTTAGAPGTVKCDTVGDRVQYSAQGKFKDAVLENVLRPAGSANNTSPLSFTVGDTAANRNLLSASFDGLTNATMGQVDPTYPRFECRTSLNSTTCQEEVTQTITVTLKGPDTFVLASGADTFLALCNAQDGTRLTRLFTLLTKVVNFLDWWENNHPNAKLRELIDQAKTFLLTFNTPPSDPQCPGTKLIQAQMLFNAFTDQVTNAAAGALPADPAPTGTGTIVIRKVIPPTGSGVEEFGFTGIGEGIPTSFNIETTDYEGSAQFDNLSTGAGGGSRTIQETGFPTLPSGSFWLVKGVSCESALYSDDAGDTQWSVSDSESGRHLDTLTITKMEDGDTLTCTFINVIGTLQ